MATIVYIDTDIAEGEKLAEAIEGYRKFRAYIRENNDRRAQLIAVSRVEFGKQFGIAVAPNRGLPSGSEQAMSDRWGSIAEGIYAGLDEFVDTIVAAHGASPSGDTDPPA